MERRAANTGPIDADGSEKVELFLVLRGQRAGLPIYCSQFSNFRIEGRAIPSRLVLDPTSAGLAGTEIHWVELRSTGGSEPWRRSALARGDNQWSIPVVEFDGPSAPGLHGSSGTGRYAAAALPPGTKDVLETDGWSKRADWADPERSPGLRVSRFRGHSISGRARALARLPVSAGATVSHARERVAFRPAHVVLAAYESLGSVRLDGDWNEPIDGESWAWLFDVIVDHGVRGTQEGALAIGPRGRGLPWVIPRKQDDPGLRRDDIVLLDDHVAILQQDNGDGWLGNEDFAVHTGSGELSQGRFGQVPGRQFRIVRPRNFSWLRLDLREAGYGTLGQAFTFDAALGRAIGEFERDHGLPVDGRPDPEMEASLKAFLKQMRAANEPVTVQDPAQPLGSGSEADNDDTDDDTDTDDDEAATEAQRP